MDDLAIIFIYTNKDEITSINLNSIKKHNPDIPIFEVNYRSFTKPITFIDNEPLSKWSVQKLWYSCDNIFLYWYLSTSYRAKNYMLVEWDTYCHETSFLDFFGDVIYSNNGLVSSKVINIDSHPNDVWFVGGNQDILCSLFNRQNICKFSPMSCSVVSDDCVNGIIEYIKDHPLANRLYIETKFSSIASLLGFPIKEYSQKFYDHITYHQNTCENLIKKLPPNNREGVFHPIKKLSVYKTYFYKNNNSSSIKIHSAIYGAGVDMSEEIGLLIHNNIDKTNVNNNLANGDPAPFRTKKLFLTYEKNGQIYHKIVSEGQNLDIKSL